MAVQIALFLDGDNIIQHVKKVGGFRADLILRALKKRGKVVVKRAYGNCHQLAPHRQFLAQVGFELRDLPHRNGKNGVDIHIAVDAMEILFTRPHITTFVLASGDGDFTALVAKLHSYGKRVIGIAVSTNISPDLLRLFDEVIFYDDLLQTAASQIPKDDWLLLLEAIRVVERQGKEPVATRVKQAILRHKPAFSERNHGFAHFSTFLKEAQRRGLITLRRNQTGNWVASINGKH